jgi:hypothetical protein
MYVVTPPVAFVHVNRTIVNKKIAQLNELCMSLFSIQFHLFFWYAQFVKPWIPCTLNVYIFFLYSCERRGIRCLYCSMGGTIYRGEGPPLGLAARGGASSGGGTWGRQHPLKP